MTETANCANAAAGIANIRNANNRKRVAGVFGLAFPVTFRLPVVVTFAAQGCVD